jgi:Ca2+/Na+ antiporter
MKNLTTFLAFTIIYYNHVDIWMCLLTLLFILYFLHVFTLKQVICHDNNKNSIELTTKFYMFVNNLYNKNNSKLIYLQTIVSFHNRIEYCIRWSWRCENNLMISLAMNIYWIKYCVNNKPTKL